MAQHHDIMLVTQSVCEEPNARHVMTEGPQVYVIICMFDVKCMELFHVICMNECIDLFNILISNCFCVIAYLH